MTKSLKVADPGIKLSLPNSKFTDSDKCSISLVSMAFRKKTEHSCTLSGVQTELSIILNFWILKEPETKNKTKNKLLMSGEIHLEELER